MCCKWCMYVCVCWCMCVFLCCLCPSAVLSVVHVCARGAVTQCLSVVPMADTKDIQATDCVVELKVAACQALEVVARKQCLNSSSNDSASIAVVVTVPVAAAAKWLEEDISSFSWLQENYKYLPA